MTHIPRIFLALIVMLDCSSAGPIDPLDELAFQTDFESGWDGWEPDTAFMAIGTGIVPYGFDVVDSISGMGSDHCVLMEAVNFTDSVYQWIIRSFAVSQGGRYVARVDWTTGPVQGLESHIVAIGALSTRQPRPSGAIDPHDPFERLEGLTVHPAPDVPTSVQLNVESEFTLEAGETIWAAVGYTSGFEGPGRACVDDIMVTIRRVRAANP